MSPRPAVSVVIPVRDGARYLPEVLAALRDQDVQHDVLVIDSGSRDGSAALARAAGARVHEIGPASFAHGRTRNLGAELTTGDVLAFLTQDATPLPGWLGALLDVLGEDERVGAAYGPQRPRPDAPPMVAREIDAFFARRDDPLYLSNVNAAYRRTCWQQVRFPDVAYAEDHAFAVAMTAQGWRIAYAPEAVVLHSHDYPLRDAWRRAFDEARALRETRGRVEQITPRATGGAIVRWMRADDAWMREHGYGLLRRARWWPRALGHHAGRKAFAWLGSRAHRLPPRLRRALSLEGRAA